jgi:PhzF family phenazine biosynthesis protein
VRFDLKTDQLLRIAAFSEDGVGGNPAGVLIADKMPEVSDMQLIAADVGYSETVFAAPSASGWRARYFSPQSEVPFCGHATIALGAALALRDGDGVFNLSLNHAHITVEGRRKGNTVAAALQSPPTHSKPASPEETAQVLALFGYTADDINAAIPPALIHAGADHFALILNSRHALTSMDYQLESGRGLMAEHGWVTIFLGFAESEQLFHVRNAFASGGVLEDPATGAAAAAFGGYLRDIHWPHSGKIDIVQGEDMGMKSRIIVEISNVEGESVRVSGTARVMRQV